MKRSNKLPLIASMLSVAMVLGMFGSPASARDEVCVYDERDWRGDRFCTAHSIRNLADEDWNDDIASIEVDEGLEVILYEHADYRGRSVSRKTPHRRRFWIRAGNTL